MYQWLQPHDTRTSKVHSVWRPPHPQPGMTLPELPTTSTRPSTGGRYPGMEPTTVCPRTGSTEPRDWTPRQNGKVFGQVGLDIRAASHTGNDNHTVEHMGRAPEGRRKYNRRTEYTTCRLIIKVDERPQYPSPTHYPPRNWASAMPTT